jgi:type IV pilus assembly protein PilC
VLAIISPMIFIRKRRFNFSRLPVIADCLQTLSLIHFCKHLAISLSAGMPILEALKLSSGNDQPRELVSAIHQLRAALSAGHNMHHAMQPHAVFPLLLQQMVKVGEESGTLDIMLNRSATLMESELNARIIHLTRLLEPLIMSVLGVLIGGLVIGMYLPVFNLGSVI